MVENIIELKNLCKSYDELTILDNFSLNIKKNEFLTLLGPSGCGKTTTLKIIAGFEYADDGKVIFEGKDINNTPPYQRPVNTVFQKYALLPHMNIYENIVLPIKLDGIKPDDDYVEEILKLLKLEDKKYFMPNQLSGGQQQRLCIARSLAGEPEVLLMDEPTSALDPISTSKVEDLIQTLKKDYSIIIVTHNMQQAARISDQTAFFLNGEVVEYDKTEIIYSNPNDKRTDDYISGKFG